ncbi:MAG TPA: universal stress protein [Casimicrobiaceae bacterium]
MFKRILVATDGSPTSNRGLKIALALAKEQNSTLYVVHVVDDMAIALGLDGGVYVPADYVEGLVERLRSGGRKVLAAAQKLAQKEGQAIKPLLAETLGRSVAQAILAEVKKSRADLIVLGTHGRRGLSRLVMGSDAEAVLRETGVPVLLVRSASNKRASRAR